MIDSLKLINLPAGSGFVPSSSRGDVFILSTCQRTIILGLNVVPFSYISQELSNIEIYSGIDAYQTLLQIISGLKSQLIGENEIINQFKQGYDEYKSLKSCNRHLLSIIEKLFKDSKEIRSKYLIEVGQQSYAGISRRVVDQTPPTKNSKILIIGSGALALSLIKLLNKKYELVLTARNKDKLNKIKSEFNVSIEDWKPDFAYHNYSHVINTVGTDIKYFTEIFFTKWTKNYDVKDRLFIDLGSPSIVETELTDIDNVLRLKDIFERGAMLDKVKQQRIDVAHTAINELTLKRQKSFTVNFPFGWEELQFA